MLSVWLMMLCIAQNIMVEIRLFSYKELLAQGKIVNTAQVKNNHVEMFID
jgi:hypothetical protein